MNTVSFWVECSSRLRDAIFCHYCGASACSWDCYVAHYAAEHCLPPSYPGIVLLPDETPVGSEMQREIARTMEDEQALP